MTHKPTFAKQQGQDFISLNKMAVKMNATNYNTFKDFIKTVDFKKKIKEGQLGKIIKLPATEFTYGVRNRTPTPIKDVINGEYGNRAEQEISKEYQTYIREKRHASHFAPRVTRHFNQMMQTRHQKQFITEKPLYKMKMFQSVKSRVAEDVKNFKKFEGENSKFNYKPKRNLKINTNHINNNNYDDGVDAMINKVQNEINETR